MYFSARHQAVSLIEVSSIAEQALGRTMLFHERLERAERRELVVQALGRIEPHDRTILVLREYECFDYKTIAEVLEINLGTVRSRLSRARVRL